MGAGSSLQAQATEDCGAVERLQVEVVVMVVVMVVTMVMVVVMMIVMAVEVTRLHNGGCNQQGMPMETQRDVHRTRLHLP